MSYHIKGNGSFKDLPERILVREDGYMSAYKFEGEPIVDYWYVPEAENAELRKLVSVLVHCLNDTDGCDTCPINGNPYDVSTIWAACDTLRDMLQDAGFEVDE